MHDHNLVLVSDRENLDGASGPAAVVRVALARHSRLYQVLRQAIFPLHDQAFLLPWSETREPRVPRVSDAERAANFDAMQATMAAWGGRLALGHLPFVADLTGQGGPRIGAEWASAWGSAHAAGIVDLRACCRGANLVLPLDPGHLSARGNRMVGEAAAPVVAGLLGQE